MKRLGLQPARLLAYALVAVTAFGGGASAACAQATQETVVKLDPAKTKVQFTLGATAHTVHGTFKLKGGQIRFDPATGKAAGDIAVDARSGDTDSSGRDKKMRDEVLLSEKYGDIVFVPNRVQGAISPQGSSQVQVTGKMRLLGQEHDMTLAFTVHSSAGNLIEISTRFTVPYVEWGLKNPSSFLLRVEKSVDVEVYATGEMISPASAQH